jgi:hypothetical protein
MPHDTPHVKHLGYRSVNGEREFIIELSADFISAMCKLDAPIAPKPDKPKRVSKAVKATTTNWKRK